MPTEPADQDVPSSNLILLDSLLPSLANISGCHTDCFSGPQLLLLGIQPLQAFSSMFPKLGWPERSHLVPTPTQAQDEYPIKARPLTACECREYVLLQEGHLISHYIC